jgi:glyoxylase-like metal-dependent hydrolase (beta-lactamase superfamily II)
MPPDLPRLGGMDVVELAPGLHMVPFPVGHVYLWHTGPDLTVIDSGVPGSAPRIAAAIGSLGLRTTDVRRLLLTHWHGDHTGSAADLSGWIACFGHGTPVTGHATEQLTAPARS